MSELIDDELFAERSLSLAAGVFALLACVLAAVGLYGVMAYMVAQRRREFGIRLAVGASPGALSWMVLQEGAIIAIAGLALGAPCAFAEHVGTGGVVRSAGNGGRDLGNCCFRRSAGCSADSMGSSKDGGGNRSTEDA